jgi:hypothetical protein
MRRLVISPASGTPTHTNALGPNLELLQINPLSRQVLAASREGVVELVEVPPEAPVGERVTLQGLDISAFPAYSSSQVGLRGGSVWWTACCG